MKGALLLLALVALAGGGASDGAAHVDATGFGYTPAATVIASGTAVVWRASDTMHITEDGGAPGTPDPCFLVFHAPGEDSEAVRFDIVDGRLVATSGGVATDCGNAAAMPDGSHALPFYCVLHPPMRGALVVTP